MASGALGPTADRAVDAVSALLEVRRISHSFRGLRVLRGAEFDVPEQSITGLIGPNGAGKSTLFNIVSGALTPSEGDIVYDGEVVTTLSVAARSHRGLVRTFQTPHVFANLTVHENLMAGCYKRGASGFVEAMLRLPRSRREFEDAGRMAEEIAATFGLETVLQEMAGKLPAGAQRLVELARAAVGEPRLLCLDEPSSGLSAREVEQLLLCLQRLNQGGATILLVSHDMDLMRVASHVNVLCFGEIIMSGAFDAVKADARVREAYLGA